MLYKELSTEQLVVLRDRYQGRKDWWEAKGYRARLRPTSHGEQYLCTISRVLNLIDDELKRRGSRNSN